MRFERPVLVILLSCAAIVGAAEEEPQEEGAKPPLSLGVGFFSLAKSGGSGPLTIQKGEPFEISVHVYNELATAKHEKEDNTLAELQEKDPAAAERMKQKIMSRIGIERDVDYVVRDKNRKWVDSLKLTLKRVESGEEVKLEVKLTDGGDDQILGSPFVSATFIVSPEASENLKPGRYEFKAAIDTFTTWRRADNRAERERKKQEEPDLAATETLEVTSPVEGDREKRCELMMAKASYYKRLKSWEKCLQLAEELETVIESKREKFSTRLMRADCLLALGREAEALNYLEAALEFFPYDPKASDLYGLLNMQVKGLRAKLQNQK